MSQAKVEAYKQSKKNRKQEIAKEKRKAMAGRLCGVALAAAILGWAGSSFYAMYEESRPAKTIQCDTSAIDEYMNGISY